jgi:hypothetical protein
LVAALSRSGVTIFLTTHRLAEAERLCDRVAILNTTLRTIGRPAQLRDQLFARTLTVKTLAPLGDPGRVFGGLPAVNGWHQNSPVAYVEDDAGRPPGTGHRPQGAAGFPAQPHPHRRHGGRPRAVLRPTVRRRLTLDPAAATALEHEHVLLYMLGIPAVVPAFVAAYSVVGERQQGTLEPLLTTPVRRQELLLGKAMAALAPSLLVAYLVYGLYLACVELFAAPAVASALIRLPDLLVQVCFTPLLAGWSIWVAILISTRSNDVRVAQQFAVLASLPSIAVTTLVR